MATQNTPFVPPRSPSTSTPPHQVLGLHVRPCIQKQPCEDGVVVESSEMQRRCPILRQRPSNVSTRHMCGRILQTLFLVADFTEQQHKQFPSTNFGNLQQLTSSRRQTAGDPPPHPHTKLKKFLWSQDFSHRARKLLTLFFACLSNPASRSTRATAL